VNPQVGASSRVIKPSASARLCAVTVSLTLRIRLSCILLQTATAPARNTAVLPPLWDETPMTATAPWLAAGFVV